MIHVNYTDANATSSKLRPRTTPARSVTGQGRTVRVHKLVRTGPALASDGSTFLALRSTRTKGPGGPSLSLFYGRPWKQKQVRDER